MKPGNITWFEMPVQDLKRAILFYTNVLGFTIDSKKLTEQNFGVIKKEEAGIGGVLMHKQDIIPGTGAVLFFYIIDIAEALNKVKKYGGTITSPKTIIKQHLENGNIIIPQTLIDNNIGYFAEITDSEGNRIALHSNS